MLCLFMKPMKMYTLLKYSNILDKCLHKILFFSTPIQVSMGSLGKHFVCKKHSQSEYQMKFSCKTFRINKHQRKDQLCVLCKCSVQNDLAYRMVLSEFLRQACYSSPLLRQKKKNATHFPHATTITNWCVFAI